MFFKKFSIKDFLLFRRMLLPWLLQIIFWVGTFLCFFVGIFDLFKGTIALGLEIFFLGPLLLRILCEFMILFFRMNETLTDIKNSGCLCKTRDKVLMD